MGQRLNNGQQNEIIVPMLDAVQAIDGSHFVFKELKPYYLRDTAHRTLIKVWVEGHLVQMRWVSIAHQKVIKFKTIHCVIKKQD